MNTYVAEVLAATSSVSFFGTDESLARKKYLLYAKHVHPDREGGSNDAFIALQRLYSDHGNPADSTPKSNVISTRNAEYVLGSTLRESDVFKAIQVEFQDDATSTRHTAEMLISLAARDNDLMGAMSTSLRKMREVPEQYRVFFPKMVERFIIPQTGGRRAVVVLEGMPGFVSVKDIMEAYPNGIDGRNVAWMFKRMLVAVGNTADMGISHGACTPESFMIHPEEHGLILRDWQYSVPLGEPLVAVPTDYRDLYPESILKKSATNRQLDVSMAAKTASRLLDDDAPDALKSFFKGCMQGSLPTAAELLKEFDSILRNVYGAPKFQHFSMPKK